MTGHNILRGPRGTGFLYAERATTAHIEPILLDNHAAKWTDDNAYTTRGDAAPLRELGALLRRRHRPEGRRRPGQ